MEENREVQDFLVISLCKQSYTQGIHIVWIVKMCIKLWTMWITLKTGENTGKQLLIKMCVTIWRKDRLCGFGAKKDPVEKGKLHFPQGAGKAKE